MTHPLTASPSVAAVRMESRQARLDAAIALFRSEASASGYVVEEVRLRLPVPDVDVLPRVVIAQQSASSTPPPPPFPRTKQHRPLYSYPRRTSFQREYPPVQEQNRPFVNPTKRSYGIPGRANTDHNGKIRQGGANTGFKRTVSGSVIFHPVPAKANPSPQHGTAITQNATNPAQKKGPLSSIPYLPTKDGKTLLQPSDQQDRHYWKTVIGGERGKQILQAAESMQRLRHAKTGKIYEEAEKPVAMDISECPEERKADVAMKQERAVVATRGSAQPRTEIYKTTRGEGTHHINGHDIPESDVQLLLSSAVDISARKKQAATNIIIKSERESIRDRKSKPSKTILAEVGKQKRVKSTSVSNGKHGSRRSNSDRRASGSSTARPYKCTKCPSSFDREGHLRVHILAVHEKKRPFVCQVCDASFGHSSSLLRHVRTVHQASPAVGSGKTCMSSRNNLYSSDSATTKSEIICDDAQDDSEKHFRCSACRMAFNRVALLNRHVAEKHPLQTSLSDTEDNLTNPT
ncbi:unnamed protein product [Chondrus crispus]|uniref:C2H2-type domain-containing protein n=1 Tax=Chondrus crispus TaxID=2769 RepID=R7Q0F2_CHOCR|nr:unnamed protein product [Chondrus crispus]CDF32132.1 unnamed protein product [Chondrus crispus]|eukprot:XP_005711797.1 unnamed protein product [Chondrus crispus]